MHREAAAEHGLEQLLGARLAVGSPDGDDRTSPSEPAVAAERAERDQRVGHLEHGHAKCRRATRVVHHERRRTGGDRLPQKVVRVEGVALECDEAFAGPDLSRVGRDPDKRAPIGRAAAEGLRDTREGPERCGTHRVVVPRLLMNRSCTIDFSSNGSVVVPRIWYVSCPLPASRTRSRAGSASATACAMASRRSSMRS